MDAKKVKLLAFLQGSTKPEQRMPGCANYNSNRSDCLLGELCLVEQGKRCDYFERCVLPTAAYNGQLLSLTRQYEEKTGATGLTGRSAAMGRDCPDCGAELSGRARYCDPCKKRRRQNAYRKARLTRNSLGSEKPEKTAQMVF